MSDFNKVLTKIRSMEALVKRDSISPVYLGCILEDILRLIKSMDVSGLLKHLDANALFLIVDAGLDYSLAKGDRKIISCLVFRGFESISSPSYKGEEVVVGWNISRDSGNPDADNLWNTSPKASEFNGIIPLEYEDLGLSPSATFKITAYVKRSPLDESSEEVSSNFTVRRIEPLATDRGAWILGESYFAGDMLNPATGYYEISDVWVDGCRWRCLKSLTSQRPAFGCSDWAFVEGDPAFHVYFTEPEQLVNASNFKLTLTVAAEIYNQDVTHLIADSDVEWSRYSETKDGTARTGLDNAWTSAHRNSGRQLTITPADCDFNSTPIGKIQFTATVTLRNPSGAAEPLTATAEWSAE